MNKWKADEVFGKRMNENLGDNTKGIWKEENRCRREVCVRCEGVVNKSERLHETEDEVSIRQREVSD